MVVTVVVVPLVVVVPVVIEIELVVVVTVVVGMFCCRCCRRDVPGGSCRRRGLASRSFKTGLVLAYYDTFLSSLIQN